MGLREKMLARRGLRRERVDIPGLDEPVYVRQLTPREKDEYEASRWDHSGKRPKLDLTNTRARLVALTVVNEAGGQVFGDRDVDALGELEPDMIEQLVDVALRINGLTAEEEKKPEAGLKNGRACASPTDSPSTGAGDGSVADGASLTS